MNKEITLYRDEKGVLRDNAGYRYIVHKKGMTLLDAMMETKYFKSKGEAKRLIKQGGVKLFKRIENGTIS